MIRWVKRRGTAQVVSSESSSPLYGKDRQLVPIPDPTKLTTEAVERTTIQFQREISTLREILEAQLQGVITSGRLRMDSIEKYAALLSEQHSQIRRELQEKTDNLEDVSRRVRGEISEEISHSRELTALLRVDLLAEINHIREVRDEKFENISIRFDERNVWLHEKFSGLALQFQERDVRTAQTAISSRQALEAALEAAKELVGQQYTANAAEAAKAEAFDHQAD